MTSCEYADLHKFSRLRFSLDSMILPSLLTMPICCISCIDTIFAPICMKKCSVSADSLPFGTLFMKYSCNLVDMHDFCRNFILFPMREILFHEIAQSCHDTTLYSPQKRDHWNCHVDRLPSNQPSRGRFAAPHTPPYSITAFFYIHDKNDNIIIEGFRRRFSR